MSSQQLVNKASKDAGATSEKSQTVEKMSADQIANLVKTGRIEVQGKVVHPLNGPSPKQAGSEKTQTPSELAKSAKETWNARKMKIAGPIYLKLVEQKLTPKEIRTVASVVYYATKKPSLVKEFQALQNTK